MNNTPNTLVSATSERKRLIARLVKRDGGSCHYCGIPLEANGLTGYNPNGVSVDHVIPQNRGGSNHIDNLVLACRRCNSQKKTKNFQEFSFAKQVDGMLRFLMDGEL